jgi:DsbC/DsbD-like thiol-disulfide interchange protein
MQIISMRRVLFIAILFAAVSVIQANAQSVSGSIANGSVARGGKAKGSIILNIPGGLHVNSNRPASEYAIPTSVRLSASGVKVGSVNYPRGKNRKFQFSENHINVYEGRAVFPFTVEVPENFKGNAIRVRAVIRYQACTEEVCYPPKSAEVTLTAKVR